MTKKEIEIIDSINKLSRQLDYHCSECESAKHTDFLQQAIDDLERQLKEFRKRHASNSNEYNVLSVSSEY